MKSKYFSASDITRRFNSEACSPHDALIWMFLVRMLLVMCWVSLLCQLVFISLIHPCWRIHFLLLMLPSLILEDKTGKGIPTQYPHSTLNLLFLMIIVSVNSIHDNVSIQDKGGTLLRDSNKDGANIPVLPHLVAEELNIAAPWSESYSPCAIHDDVLSSSSVVSSALEVNSAAGVKGIATTSMTTVVNLGLAPHFGVKSVCNQEPPIEWCLIQKAMLLHLELKSDQNDVLQFSVLSSRSSVITRDLTMCLILRTMCTRKSPAVPISSMARAHAFYSF